VGGQESVIILLERFCDFLGSDHMPSVKVVETTTDIKHRKKLLNPIVTTPNRTSKIKNN